MIYTAEQMRFQASLWLEGGLDEVGEMLRQGAAAIERVKELESALAKQDAPTITLTGEQLSNALYIVNPDGHRDKDQLETELSIRWFEVCKESGSGEDMPAGYYGWITEYPEEGRVPLDTALAQGKSNEQ